MLDGKNRTFTRQMYANDSEVGRMKLQSVKENLYEATTKVVLYSIEMYTKKSLGEWARTDLLKKLDKANNNLKRVQDELEQGHIGMFDITNGCSVLNDFVRKDTLAQSRNALSHKIEQQESKLQDFDEELQLLRKRKNELESQSEEELSEEYEEIDDFFNEDVDDDYGNFDDFDEETENYDELEEETEDDDEDDEEEKASTQSSELELFTIRVYSCKSHGEIDSLIDEITENKKALEIAISGLKDLTKSKKDLLSKLDIEEKENLEKLRVLRNTGYAHKNEDELDISQIGTWEPEAGPLYEWARAILNYIKTIEKRYRFYGLFDEYYAAREGKDKFDGCKVYVQRQIKELYVNHSNIVLEFAGDLYDKEDEEFNFRKLIESMAINWDTGIRYLTVATNDDLPEWNLFFKECLSGTKKYVDCYLVDRNALREAVKKRDDIESDYIYFHLLYHLNPSMKKIYWKGKSFTKKEFAQKILYKIIKVKNRFQFDGRLEDFEKYLDGIDIKKWCDYHILSEVFFKAQDDDYGAKIAKNMEEEIVAFCNFRGKGRSQKFRKAIKASVRLYFYMCEEFLFTYTSTTGKSVHWKSIGDACKYLENAEKFSSYVELNSFIGELYTSDYFKIWKKTAEKHMGEREDI
ncbi:MAG: hypothetical protein K5675_00560 [Lachnospiraceae bacterium]|nr:hypothetical protein [Lachnospiraceae bacterium]